MAAFVQTKSAGGSSAAPQAVFDASPTLGNLLVAAVFSASTTTITMTSTGWTPLTNITGGTGGSTRDGRLFYKIAGSGESTTVTAAAGNAAWVITIAEYSGIRTASPLNVETGQLNVSSGTVPTGTVTALGTNGGLLAMYAGIRTATTFSGETVDDSTTGVTQRGTVGTTSASGDLFDRFITNVSGTYQGKAINANNAVQTGHIALFNQLFAGTIQADNTGSAGTSASAATISWTHTIFSSNKGIIFAILSNNGTSNVTNIAYAGTNMTKIIAGTSSTVAEQEIWFLLHPPAGLGTFNGTFSTATTQRTASSLSLNGVDQTTPILGSTNGTFASATSGSLTLTSTNDKNWLIGGVSMNVGLGTVDATANPVDWTSGTLTSQITKIASLGPISPAGAGTIRYTFATATGVQQLIQLNSDQTIPVAPKIVNFRTLMGAGQA